MVDRHVERRLPPSAVTPYLNLVVTSISGFLIFMVGATLFGFGLRAC